MPFVLNDFANIAKQIGADCVHLGQEDLFDAGLTHRSELPSCPGQIGLSSHSPEQARRAIQAGADYVAVGPVFATGTKPGSAPVKLDYVRWAAARSNLPWFAIGGITLENLDDVLRAGARRICVVSAILNASNIKQACIDFKKRLTCASEELIAGMVNLDFGDALAVKRNIIRMRVRTVLTLLIAVNVLWAAAFIGYVHRSTTPVIKRLADVPAPGVKTAPFTPTSNGATVLVATAPTNNSVPAQTNAAPRAPRSLASVDKKFGWRDVTNDTYLDYVSSLRAVGCPEKQIRSIVTSDVNELFDQRVSRMPSKRTRNGGRLKPSWACCHAEFCRRKFR